MTSSSLKLVLLQTLSSLAAVLLLLSSSAFAENNAFPISYQDCVLSATNDCSLSKMTKPTLVYPGGNTRCAWNDDVNTETNSTYRFQVNPGRGADRQKVMVAFQSGGGCFSKSTCSRAFHSIATAFLGEAPFFYNADPESRGIYNTTNPENPFKDWTMVVVMYCTADIHIGNAILPSDSPSVSPMHFNGYNNVQSVLTWVKKHVVSPTHVTLAGSSAGALGVQVYAKELFSVFKNQELYPTTPVLSAVIDSYAGYLPDNQGEVLKLWKYCEVAVGFSDELMEACRNGKITVPLVSQEIISTHRDIPFAFIQAKNDYVQKMFFCVCKYRELLGMTVKNINRCIDQSDFYTGVKDTMRDDYTLMSSQNNVVTYFLNSDMHIYLKYDEVLDAGNREAPVTLMQWIHNVAMSGNTKVINSYCSEPLTEGGVDYSCDAQLSNLKFLPLSERNSSSQHSNNNAAISCVSSSPLMMMVVLLLSILTL